MPDFFPGRIRTGNARLNLIRLLDQVYAYGQANNHIAAEDFQPLYAEARQLDSYRNPSVAEEVFEEWRESMKQKALDLAKDGGWMEVYARALYNIATVPHPRVHELRGIKSDAEIQELAEKVVLSLRLPSDFANYDFTTRVLMQGLTASIEEPYQNLGK